MLGGYRTRVNIEKVVGGQAEMDGLGGLGLKPPCRQVSRFGPQTRGRVRCIWIAERRARDAIACIEAKPSYESACPSDASPKSWTVLPLRRFVS